MNVLVVAAHPDDEILGCGGTMARMAREGHRVTVAILGQGAASRFSTGDRQMESAVAELKERSLKAAGILGVGDVAHFGLPDNRFDTLGLLDITKILEGIDRRVRPDEVYVQHGGDLNIDHALTFRAAMTAFRPLPESRVRGLYAYEVASSTEWAFGHFSPVFTPDTFVDIGAFLDLKLEALNAYEAEVRRLPHPRSPEGVRGMATMRGASVGLRAAEAFETIWRKVVA